MRWGLREGGSKGENDKIRAISHAKSLLPLDPNKPLTKSEAQAIKTTITFTIDKGTVIFLSFWTGRSGQTVQTAPDQGLHCLQFPLHLLDELL